MWFLITPIHWRSALVPGWQAFWQLIEPWHTLLWWLGGVSGFLFFASLLALPWAVSRIPADYFLPERRHPVAFSQRHPLLRWAWLLLKNLLGLVLLLAGILMLVLPGQGLLTIIAGLILMNFPGKYRLERWLVARPGVTRAINWMRRRRGAVPLKVAKPAPRAESAGW